jgi:signal transduction histidine kinase
VTDAAPGPSGQEIFGVVSQAIAELTGADACLLLRFEPDDTLTLLARWPAAGVAPVHREQFSLSEEMGAVRDSGRAMRFGPSGWSPWDAFPAVMRGPACSSVAVPIILDGRVWGLSLAGSARDGPFPDDAEAAMAALARLLAAALANLQAGAQLQALADGQGALRRVAELAAREAPVDEVLGAVAREASRLADVSFTTMLRFESDGSTEIVALDGAPAGVVIGMRAPATGDGATQRLWRTGQAASIDNLAEMSGHWPQVAHGAGFSTSLSVPVLMHGTLWGALVAIGRHQLLSAGVREQLANFAELAGISIDAAQARRELRLLADEQAALRRVAELVARGSAPGEVFIAVATEASKLLGDLAAGLMRFESGDFAVAVAVGNSHVPLGLRVPLNPDTAVGGVFRTARPVRLDRLERTSLADLAADLGVGAVVAVPVSVEGRVWGALTATTSGSPLPADAEDRLTQFAELAAAAIANAENKAKLTASRARVVATADETRRRLQRDVHDSAQQRLVHTIIALKLARDAIAAGDKAGDLIEEALKNAERANRDLRDVVRGILPAALTRGGLRMGLESLADDLTLPVEVRVTAPRLSSPIETTAYFIVAEALANVVKHARASAAVIDIRVDGDRLVIEVRDDGAGGADPARGTGLTGLLDRVEANEGTLTMTSPAGMGTTLHAVLPLSPPPSSEKSTW